LDENGSFTLWKPHTTLKLNLKIFTGKFLES
jgi:hypothetical protein